MTEPTFLQTTRAAYDTIAADYADRTADLTGIPVERAMMSLYADLVLAAGGGPTLDVGCGPGSCTAHLAALGLDVRGIDLSPGLLEQARSRYPQLRFEEGTMTALDVTDASMTGVSAMYSVIHIPEDLLPSVFAEFHRVLAPGGELLLAFMNRDEYVLRTEAFGHTISLEYHFRPPHRMAQLLTEAGFDVHTQVTRTARTGENIPRGLLLARRPA